MEKSFQKMLLGYQAFRKKYASDDQSIMQFLSYHGQKPEVMIVACCDSRVDPALILQCEPGDLFVVRNVANIVPPYQKDEAHHGTSAALEFAIRFLKVKHLILLGHSQCGGIKALMERIEDIKNKKNEKDKNEHNKNDFITNWVSIVEDDHQCAGDVDEYAKLAIKKSYQNCLTFPWIKEKVDENKLAIHLWYFDIKTGRIHTYSKEFDQYQPL